VCLVNVFIFIRCVSKTFAAVAADLRRLCVGQTVHRFKPVIEIFPKLKNVIIENRRILTPDFFDGIDLSALLLTRICFSKIDVISSAWISAAADIQFPSISQFEGKLLNGCSADAFMHFICRFSSLRSIRLENCFPLEDAQLSQLTERLVNLSEISISKFSQLRNVQIVSSDLKAKHLVLSMCPALSTLSVPVSLISCVLQGTAITANAVEGVIRTCSSLLLLDISHCHSLENVNIVSSTLSILKAGYSSKLVSVCIECPLLQFISIKGCNSLEQFALHSECITSIDLTMSKALKCIELRCPQLTTLIICGCENLKYYGRYFREDYKGICLDSLMRPCPSLRFGNGSCLAGAPVYAEYIAAKKRPSCSS
jgi:hypothetical protein